MKNPVRFLMHVPVPWVFILSYLLGVALQSVHRSPISQITAMMSTVSGGVLFVVGAVIADW
jgi:hypothetical protein